MPHRIGTTTDHTKTANNCSYDFVASHSNRRCWSYRDSAMQWIPHCETSKLTLASIEMCCSHANDCLPSRSRSPCTGSNKTVVYRIALMSNTAHWPFRISRRAIVACTCAALKARKMLSNNMWPSLSEVRNCCPKRLKFYFTNHSFHSFANFAYRNAHKKHFLRNLRKQYYQVNCPTIIF